MISQFFVPSIEATTGPVESSMTQSTARLTVTLRSLKDRQSLSDRSGRTSGGSQFKPEWGRQLLLASLHLSVAGNLLPSWRLNVRAVCEPRVGPVQFACQGRIIGEGKSYPEVPLFHARTSSQVKSSPKLPPTVDEQHAM